MRTEAKRSKIILFLYNRLFDPVIQSNFWLYISDLLKEESYRFHLVTYEDPRHPLSQSQLNLLKIWKTQGLEWTPLEWHSGTGAQAKIIDLVNGFLVCAQLRLNGFKHLLSVGSIAGAFTYLFSLCLNFKTFLYCYEPHSEYAADNNIWPRSSRHYKVTNFLEKRAAHHARVIASGTQFMGDRLNEWGVSASFVKIPTVVDERRFHFDHKLRESTREALGLSSKWVLLYPGKFGDLYYREELALAFKWLYQIESRLHLLIVTPQDPLEIHKLLASSGLVEGKHYTLTSSSYTEIPKYFFASDFGLVAVPPGPSKKFISNIKVGEFLCSGLPFLITEGVSEDYIHASKEQVGVVVRDFQEDSITEAWAEIQDFLTENATQRRARCRQFGVSYRGFSKLNQSFRKCLDLLVRS